MDDISEKEKEIKLKESKDSFSDSKSSEHEISEEERSVRTPELGDNYEILEKVGEGGMGSVYKVRDKSLDKVFAVKVLKKDIAQDQAAYKRFEQETDATSKLSHPNVIAIYKHGQTKSGEPYFVMDYLEGKSLAEYIEEQSLNTDQIIDIFIQICQGLEHAHENKIIHRDIKPTNIILNRNDTGMFNVKILDFGIAKVVDGSVRETHNLTQTGEVYGSPQYMSPEQCLGFMLEEQSDIYSLGCTLYETITGKPPFAGANPIQLVVKHINENVKGFKSEFRSTKQEKQLEKVTLKCLEKEQADRIQSVVILRENLESIRDKRPIPNYSLKSKAKPTLTKRELADIVGTFSMIIAWIFLYSNYYISPYKPTWFLLIFLSLMFVYISVSMFQHSLEKIKRIKSSVQKASTWWLAIYFSSGSILVIGTIIKLVSKLLERIYDYQVCQTFDSIGSLVALTSIVTLIAASISALLFRTKEAKASYVIPRFSLIIATICIAPFVLAPHIAPNVFASLAQESSAVPELKELLLKEACKSSKSFYIANHHLSLARFLFYENRREDAYAAISSGIHKLKKKENPSQDEVYALGRLYSEESEQLNYDGRYEEAIATLKKEIALDSNPKHEDYYPWFNERFALSLYQFNNGNLIEAEKNLRIFEIDNPVQLQKSAQLRAKILAAQNKNQEALETLNKVTSKNETHLDLLFLKGLILEKIGNKVEADKVFRLAANTNSFYVQTHFPSFELQTFLLERAGEIESAKVLSRNKKLDQEKLIKGLKSEGFDKIGVDLEKFIMESK